ncbi:MAG TPA: YceI family protein, partial [Gemmatimonadales bacterium]
MRNGRAGWRLAILALGLWPAELHAQSTHPVANGTVTEGTLSFDGHASAGDFTGTTTNVAGEMKGAEGIEGVRGWVEAPVATLKTGNDRRDRDLNKSMESDKYPTMRFDLDAVTVSGTGDSVPATL